MALFTNGRFAHWKRAIIISALSGAAAILLLVFFL